ncbi:MAG: Dynamin family protein [Deltaproteobacteria bacterium]|nr:Dynamin family protein [Deltaproteobacteria bacterium]
MSDFQSGGVSISTTESLRKLTEQLVQAIDCLTGLGDDYSTSRAELELLQQRLAEGRFHLAVLGQFKRGKSTLLNALLGDDLLPTDILPVTAIPTFISSGSEITVRVYFFDRSETDYFPTDDDRSLAAFLADYVTEAGNPHNQHQVSRVEISHPAALLHQGVVLVDTPGIGSTLKHNTEVAHQILPQCDAALFLVSPDPPITEIELEYLAQIKQQLPRTFYLLNKVDFLNAEEQLASLKFLASQLETLCDGEPQVLPISARRGLQARLEGDSHAWNESGMQRVEQSLIDFFAREKQQTLQTAIARRTLDLISDAGMQLQLSLSALKLPEAELQRRLEQFRLSLPAVEREQQAAVDVLAGDLKRVIARLAEEIEVLRKKAKQQILSQVEEHLVVVEDPEQMERLVHATIATETEQFFAPAMRSTAELIRQEATRLLSLNQQRSNRLIEQVRQTAAELFDIPYHAPAAGASYSPFAVPAWSNDLFTSDMDPLGQRLSRKFFTRKYRRKRTVNRLREESRKLLNRNIEQISWALRQSLDESFRQFGSELGEQLGKTIAATRKAMEVALERSESHSRESSKTEISLRKALQVLEDIKHSLAGE